MEVKINKEIRNYTKVMFLDRPDAAVHFFLFLACGVAVALYFLLLTETLAGLLVRASPFAALGFIKYNGMTARLRLVWIKSEFIMPKAVVFPR